MALSQRQNKQYDRQRQNDIQRQSRQFEQNEIDDLQRGISVFGGMLGLLYFVRNRKPSGVLAGMVGAAFMYRGITGRSLLYESLDALDINPIGSKDGSLHLKRAVTINRPRQEIYDYWHTLENLPRIMHHVESVRTIGERRTHWVVNISPGLTLEWDAEIVEDREGERIVWRSLPDATVAHEGSVRFADAPGDRGTELIVAMSYRPPLGMAGAVVEKLHKAVTEQQIKEDLRRFKQTMETGVQATTQGQPSGT